VVGVRTARLRLLAGTTTVLALLALAGCSGDQGTDTDPEQVDAVSAPEVGACRLLTPDDVALASNATRTVDCEQRHTAETYAVGDLPAELQDVAHDDPRIATWAATTCQTGLQELLGADESLTMRSVLSWAFFRPSTEAWEQGARWYRCDAVGGDDQSRSYVALPATVRGLLAERPERRDRWMACAVGASVDGAPKIPCTRPHDWRAVGTIKVGEPDSPYPGDQQVRATSEDFCRTFVGGWLGYPDDYDYGYTWFREAEWAAGNRRSVCWARTTL
jgi:hypothetical protein